MSIRKERIQQQILKTLNTALVYQISDPRLLGVEIVSVTMSKDNGYARVFYKISEALNDEKKLIAEGLEKAKHFLKRVIGEEVRLRVIPELKFILDETEQTVARVEEILGGLSYSNQDEERLSDLYKKLDQ